MNKNLNELIAENVKLQSQNSKLREELEALKIALKESDER